MWWQLQLLSCFLVTVKSSVYRLRGPTASTLLIGAGLLCMSEPSFIKSFEKAPSFFQAWFLGQAALAVFGCIASYLVGDAGLTMKHYVGMLFALLSGYLLVS